MNRDEALARIRARDKPWDMLVIGGGATGAAIAMDAAGRGYDTLLLERADFGSGTSSRSTKLIHGGVRYLAQLNFPLVFEALRERARLKQNAPHLVKERRFIIPADNFPQALWYWLGLKFYDLLAIGGGFERSRWLSRAALEKRLPAASADRFVAGVEYSDGQFDDARLVISMLRTAWAEGGTVINYCEVTGFEHDDQGRLVAVQCQDIETGEALRAQANVIINATGPFSSEVAALDGQHDIAMAPSQGAHIVLARDFLPGDRALLIPDTADGRIMFAIPWLDHILVGTTDVAIDEAPVEPQATDAEIDFLLKSASGYLARDPTWDDILATFAGIRPLVAASGNAQTSKLSREHAITTAKSGLVSITGGKWTTARLMAEQCVDVAIEVGKLAASSCRTANLPLVDAPKQDESAARFAEYGQNAAAIQALIQDDPALGEPLEPGIDLCAAQVLYAMREEMARTPEDILARRSRYLFLDMQLGSGLAAVVAELMIGVRGGGDAA